MERKMIIPVKKITVITLTENEKNLLTYLGKLGVIQLKKLNEKEFMGFKEASSKELQKYALLYNRLQTLKTIIEKPEEINKLKDRLKELPSEKIEETPSPIAKEPLETEKSKSFKEKISVGGPALPYWPRKTIVKKQLEVSREKESTPEQALNSISLSLKELEEKVSYLEERIKTTIEKLILIRDAKPFIQILKEQKINPENIGEFNHIFAKAGIAKTKFVPFLKHVFNKYRSITFKEVNLSPNETFLYIAGLKEFKPYVEELLSSIEFNEFKLPPGLPGEPEKDLVWIDEETKKLEEEIQKLKEEVKDLEVAVKYGLDVCLAEGNLLRSRLMSVLQGWVPINKINDLNVYLDGFNREVGGSVFYVYDDPLPNEEVPTVMENPKLFKVYEVLTRQYGYPSHEESDPTIISTILWVTMFGVMFPDFGQGLIILGLGLLFGFILKRSIMGLNFAKLGKLMIG
ncbi:MAG: V-type ATPase 116kDa subunit family protein, partial [Candidatus Bathyarchaeia archaeon]